jgi:hypothetical protein
VKYNFLRIKKTFHPNKGTKGYIRGTTLIDCLINTVLLFSGTGVNFRYPIHITVETRLDLLNFSLTAQEGTSTIHALEMLSVADISSLKSWVQFTFLHHCLIFLKLTLIIAPTQFVCQYLGSKRLPRLII